jgi:predicted  nucleic acid-binding Zn-ribbon protein
MEDLTSLADLLDLQEVDLQIDRLLSRRQGLAELDDFKAAHERVERLDAQRTTTAGELREVELELDKTNGELELAEVKSKQEENRLYAGGLSARDADYLRREVEMLRGKVSTMEDRALELMESREKLEAQIADMDTQLVEANADRSRLEGVIATEWAKIDAEIAVRESTKADMVPLVNPELLELYEQLRSDREGAVVGGLEDRICGVCHLTLSAAEEASVRKQDPPRCIHCAAILVL